MMQLPYFCKQLGIQVTTPFQHEVCDLACSMTNSELENQLTEMDQLVKKNPAVSSTEKYQFTRQVMEQRYRATLDFRALCRGVVRQNPVAIVEDYLRQLAPTPVMTVMDAPQPRPSVLRGLMADQYACRHITADGGLPSDQYMEQKAKANLMLGLL